PVDYQKMAVPYDKLPPVALKQQVSKDGPTFIQTVIMKDSATSAQLTESFKQLESAAKPTIGENPFAQKVSADDPLVAR
ncbi:MMPL family transporter, partial [Listeria monocytogenes]|nr:MMPL family transporter [Listeria monocytogenes]